MLDVTDLLGYSKNIFMFEFPKKNVSGMDYGQYSKSPPCAMNNLMWRILITKIKADISKGSKDSLGIYLEVSFLNLQQLCFTIYCIPILHLFYVF